MIGKLVSKRINKGLGEGLAKIERSGAWQCPTCGYVEHSTPSQCPICGYVEHSTPPIPPDPDDPYLPPTPPVDEQDGVVEPTTPPVDEQDGVVEPKKRGVLPLAIGAVAVFALLIALSKMGGKK